MTKVFLNGEITEEVASLVIREIYDVHPSIIRTLVVNSPGGLIEQAFGIHDVIRQEVHTTIAVGLCASMAPLLVAAGKLRISAPNTSWMLHPCTLESNEELQVCEKLIQLTKDQMHTYAVLLGRYTNKRTRHWDAIFRSNDGDTNFDAKQALEWGLIDKIWKD